MNDYDDIINLTRPTTSSHKKMSMESRAAQFAPFASLTGYKEKIGSTNNYKLENIELSEDEKDIINENLKQALESKKETTITYITTLNGKNILNKITGTIKKIDTYQRLLYFETDESLLIDNIKSVVII